MENGTKPKNFLIGVDVGSSKTHALLTNTSGQVLSFTESGCGNYEVVGAEGMTMAIKSAITDCLGEAKISKDRILSMGFGIAGYDWPSERSLMTHAIEAVGIDAEFSLVNDAEIGLIAGAPGGWGIAVDAGTGNNIRGRNKNGRIGRITGNGIPFGEFGGASEMVWLARTAATYAWSQRGSKTKLTSIFIEHAGVENEDALIEGLATNQINLPPILAKSIIQTALAGDQVAKGVVQFSARDLAKNVNAVIKQLDLKDEEFDIVLIGSLFKAGDIYISPFVQTIHSFAPGAKFITLEAPPVLGAVFLAAEKAKIMSHDFREAIIKSTKMLLNQDKLSD